MIARRLTVLAVITFLASTLLNCGTTPMAAEKIQGNKDYETINPYKSVNWEEFGQFKAGLHAHTLNSDGYFTPEEMIEDYYSKGYDIASITDHDAISSIWNREDQNQDNNFTERLKEISAGIGRNGRLMTGIPFTIEQSQASEHLNTYWANFCNRLGSTLEESIAKCEEVGGISHINHPGGAAAFYIDENGQIDPIVYEMVNGYTELYLKYPSCVGMEIFNRRYGNRENFRLFWDMVLMRTMPERPVWGFSNDDAHHMSELGFNFNIMLMPQNTEGNIRYCMENGTFYVVSLSARYIEDIDFDNINYPVIRSISVDQEENSISIEAENCDVIEWVADGHVIAAGSTIDLNDFEGEVNNYIRAQIKGSAGLCYTQPFGIIAKSGIKYGDVNADNKVNSIDYAYIKRYILEIPGYTLEGDRLLAADVDGSGKVNSIDAAYIQRYVLGKIIEFPTEKK